MKAKLRALDGPRKAQLTRQADRIATDFEAQRELDEVCLVVDMVRQSSCLFGRFWQGVGWAVLFFSTWCS